MNLFEVRSFYFFVKLGGGIVFVGNEMDYGFRDCVSVIIIF